MNPYCTVYEMEQQRMLNVNMQTCNTIIQQHVRVDMHYFNTLILLERGNPEAYQLCCPCKSFFPIVSICKIVATQRCLPLNCKEWLVLILTVPDMDSPGL